MWKIPKGVFGMKWFKNLFKKRNVELGFTLVTAGTDIEGRYSVCLQEVNDVWCICVYKCEVINGLHYFNSDERKLVCAIPLKRIFNLALSRKHLLEE
jgi:hypothetical protein